MNVGIVVAMDKELMPLLKKCGAYHETQIMNATVVKPSEYPNITIIRSGVGEIRAALAAMLLICKYGAEHIINYGFVGSYDDSLALGELVQISDVIHADMDLTAFGKKLGQYDGLDSASFVADTDFFTAHSLKMRTLISSDRYQIDTAEQEKWKKMFGHQVVDMEGAGIAYTCYNANVPFSIIKCVSNTLDSNIEEYLSFSSNGIAECSQLVFNTVFLDKAAGVNES